MLHLVPLALVFKANRCAAPRSISKFWRVEVLCLLTRVVARASGLE